MDMNSDEWCYQQQILDDLSKVIVEYRLVLLLIKHGHWRNGYLKDLVDNVLVSGVDRKLIDLSDKDLKKFLTEHDFKEEQFGWRLSDGKTGKEVQGPPLT